MLFSVRCLSCLWRGEPPSLLSNSLYNPGLLGECAQPRRRGSDRPFLPSQARAIYDWIISISLSAAPHPSGALIYFGAWDSQTELTLLRTFIELTSLQFIDVASMMLFGHMHLGVKTFYVCVLQVYYYLSFNYVSILQ